MILSIENIGTVCTGGFERKTGMIKKDTMDILILIKYRQVQFCNSNPINCCLKYFQKMNMADSPST